jgi:GMP reductase
VIDLENWGADATKVGVQAPARCASPAQTGFGTGGWAAVGAQVVRPRGHQAPSLPTAAFAASGDIAKSVRFGAMVMIGSLLPGHESRLARPWKWTASC